MYYVKIKDDFDHEITVEVLLEVYQVFDDERKLLERERYEHRKHWDKRGIEDYILADHSTALSESAEEIFFCRETFREIREVLKTCTSVQRKRFILHFFDGNSYAKIAGMQNCTPATVHKSIQAVQKKLENIPCHHKSLKYSTNPNPSPIGNRFGLCVFGAGNRT